MSETILSGLIEKVLRPEDGNWACRDWRMVSKLLDAVGESASDMVIDLIGVLVDRGEEQDAEIARLTADLAEAQAKLNVYTQATEIVTEPGHPCRAFITDGWAMISEDRYYDLLSDTAEELHADLAEAREAARELHRDLLSEGLRPDVVRWPWLEEDEQ